MKLELKICPKCKYRFVREIDMLKCKHKMEVITDGQFVKIPKQTKEERSIVAKKYYEVNEQEIKRKARVAYHLKKNKL